MIETPDINHLRRLWLAALIVGVLAFLACLGWLNSAQGPGLDWIWTVAAFGAAVVVYNVAYFVLCSIYAPQLSKLVEDDTEVEGDTVSHVVRHHETGHAETDAYVQTYASARAITAVAIVSIVMSAIALTFF